VPLVPATSTFGLGRRCQSSLQQCYLHCLRTIAVILYYWNCKWRVYVTCAGHLSPLWTHTHTRLTALCPGLPGWASTRKVKPIWILLKQETVHGSGISWAICKSAPRSRQITMPAPHCSVFYRPDALPASQPTASKHWRQPLWTHVPENHHSGHLPIPTLTQTGG